MKFIKKIKSHIKTKYFYFYLAVSKILSYWIVILISILILSVLTVFLLFVFEKNNENHSNNNFNENMVSSNSENSKIMVLHFLNLSAKNNNLHNFFNSKIIIDKFSDISVTYSNNRYYCLINGYFLSNYDSDVKTKNTVSIEKNIGYSFFSDHFSDKNLNNFSTNNLNSDENFWFFKDSEKIIPNHYINSKNAEKIAFLYSKTNYYGGYDAFNSYHKINNFIIEYDNKITDIFKFTCYFQYDDGSTSRDYSHGAFSFSIPKIGSWKYSNNLISIKTITAFAVSKFSNNASSDINNNNNSEIKINSDSNTLVMYRSYISNVFQNKTINFSHIGFSAFFNSNFSCEITPYNGNGSDISALTIDTKNLNEVNFSSSINDNLFDDNIGNIYDGDKNEGGTDQIIFFPQNIRENKCFVSVFNYYDNDKIHHITEKIGEHNYNFGYAFFEDTKAIESLANSNINPDNYIIIMPIFVMSDGINLNNNQAYIFYNNQFSINPENSGKSEFSFAW